MKTLCSALLLSLTALTAAAQAPAFTSTCSDNHRSGTSRHYCETRDLTMPAPGTQTLTIDGKANGGIEVKGYDGTEVRVRARVSGWAKTEEAAAALVRDIRISTADHTLKATGHDGLAEGWSVSYEVFVPRRTALALETTNGGISLRDLDATIRFRTTNGGVSLRNLAGQVEGRTTNGGVSIRLSGAQWQGQGLDVRTTNGGITWSLPKDYSARFETATSIGGISAGSLPVTKSGMMHRAIATTLGRGGATVKAVTTNGGIKVRQE